MRGLAPLQARGGLAVHRQAGTLTRPCTHMAVHTKGGQWPPRQSFYLRVLQAPSHASSEGSRGNGWFSGLHVGRYVHKAVHARSGRWSPYKFSYLRAVCGCPLRQAKRAKAMGGLVAHRQGGAFTRRCTHKVVHTISGLLPQKESCYFRGLLALTPPLSEVARSEGSFGSPLARRCTNKAVHTKHGSHERWLVASARFLLF